ncbi:hypothetical protein TWF173_010292 [Orbilia oligospora]|nr:hypothetical protein TWF173_010292 [Orbilia oligospora]
MKRRCLVKVGRGFGMQRIGLIDDDGGDDDEEEEEEKEEEEKEEEEEFRVAYFSRKCGDVEPLDSTYLDLSISNNN